MGGMVAQWSSAEVQASQVHGGEMFEGIANDLGFL